MHTLQCRYTRHVLTIEGTPAAELDTVGTFAFQKQLWLCMAAAALKVKSQVETYRGANIFGLLVWQLNEIWPTGGWGSLEYGYPTADGSQVLGGRWKPLHYLYSRSLYADVMATCGIGGTCYVKNDRAGLAFNGTVTLEALSFVDGGVTEVHVEHVNLGVGAGTSTYFNVNASIANISRAHHMLIATVRDGRNRVRSRERARTREENSGGSRFEDGSILAVNEIALVPPKDMQLPAAKVTVRLPDDVDKVQGSSTPNADGTYNVLVEANATALYVTVTARAHGRFSDNFFAMQSGEKRTLKFIPFPLFNVSMLASSLRVEHLQMYL